VYDFWVFTNHVLSYSDDKMKEKPIESAVSLPSMLSDHAGNPFPHPVCGPGSSYGRSPIHKAVCEMDMAAVHQELSDSIGAASLHRKDEAGFYPIHSACSLSLSDPENSSIACEITRLLIAAGGDASAVDNKRNTPLHWAARSGDADASQLLLMRNCPPGKDFLVHFDRDVACISLALPAQMLKMMMVIRHYTGRCALDVGGWASFVC